MLIARNVLGALLLVVSWGCHQIPSTVLRESADQVLARLQRSGHPLDATLGGGRVRYLGFEALPEGALPGDQIAIIHYWQANQALEVPYRVFVHALVQGAMGWVPHGDHEPVPTPDRWPPGRVIQDEHTLRLPERLPAERVELRVGLYRDNYRLPVDNPEQHDGQHRLLAGAFRVSGTALPLPRYQAPELTVPPTIDGRIHEAEWGGAPWITGFQKSRGDGPSRLTTRARLAWRATHVYLAVDAEDPDIQATWVKRDDPVFREEAIEIFIDAAGSGRDYVELQVSPRGTQFDASFRGGPRRNPNPAYNASYQVAVAVDGTLNDPSDRDRGWSSEWAIDASSIPGARLAAGLSWRINLFRIAKDRIAGAAISDESAWSAPLMGDFHNLQRFGELCFTRCSAAPGGERAYRGSRRR